MMTLRSQWIDDDENWGLSTATKGGDGSGFFGHAGRPGERGGSAPSGSAGKKQGEGAPKPTPRSSILKYSDLEKAKRVRDRADDAMGIIQGDDDQFWVVPMGEFEKLINQGYEAVPAHGR